MARIRSVDSTMPPSTASAPPDSPDPAPRGTTGMPCALAQRIVTCTCSAVSARTAASGVPAVASWVQSKRYFSTASGRRRRRPRRAAAPPARRRRRRRGRWGVLGVHAPTFPELPATSPRVRKWLPRTTTSALTTGAVENCAADSADPSRLSAHGDLARARRSARPACCRGVSCGELEVPAGLVRNKVASGRWADAPRRSSPRRPVRCRASSACGWRCCTAVRDAMVGGLSAAAVHGLRNWERDDVMRDRVERRLLRARRRRRDLPDPSTAGPAAASVAAADVPARTCRAPLGCPRRRHSGRAWACWQRSSSNG